MSSSPAGPATTTSKVNYEAGTVVVLRERRYDRAGNSDDSPSQVRVDGRGNLIVSSPISR